MSVYVLGDKSNSIDAATVNILPAAVNFSGTVPNGTSNWNSYKEEDDAGNPVNYLRGRKLVGVSHNMNGYSVVLFEKESTSGGSDGKTGTETPKNGGSVYNAVSTSEEVVIFEHQVRPSAQNDQIERVVEWIDIATFINKV